MQSITLTFGAGGGGGVIGPDGTNVPIDFLDGTRCVLKVFPSTTASGVTIAVQREVRSGDFCCCQSWAANRGGRLQL